jgi:haloacetate dehalogenase
MTDAPDLFPGFATHRIKTDGAEIFARVGGAGPPLLLLHGYPQTHACWNRIAPALAKEFTVVCADLRGYGASTGPAADAEHENYSKRTMGRDAVLLMRALGFDRFAIAGHDRGARVAYRLALDQPEILTHLAVLDIVPTLENWEGMTWQKALFSYHWPFLAQPYPLPEMLISSDADYYVLHTLESWTKAKSLDCFGPDALQHYRVLLENPASLNAVCEDYRAGAGIDRERDAADRDAGRKITVPTLAIWSTHYLGRGGNDPGAVWQRWCTDVRSVSVDSGHFVMEEAPDATLAALLPFLRS